MGVDLSLVGGLFPDVSGTVAYLGQRLTLISCDLAGINHIPAHLDTPVPITGRSVARIGNPVTHIRLGRPLLQVNLALVGNGIASLGASLTFGKQARTVAENPLPFDPPLVAITISYHSTDAIERSGHEHVPPSNRSSVTNS